MNKRIFAGLAVLGLGISFLIGCSENLEGQNESHGRRGGRSHSGAGEGSLGNWGAAAAAVPVEAGRPTHADLASYIFGNAHIEALREVEVVARVDGLLDHLKGEEGDFVSSGSVLAELDKSELKISLAEARARLENSRSAFDRTKRMLEQELTSQEELDRSKYEFQSATAQFERSDLNLRYATITAPFAGIITQRMVEQGDMIRSGTVLFNLADVEKLLVRAYIPEKEMGRIQVGKPARIESEMFPGENFSGVVEMIAPVVDPATGTVKVTVRVTGGRKKLKPGMFCAVYILVSTHKDALVISRRALIPETESPEVFMIDEDYLAHRRKVTLGISQGDSLEVLEGLGESDRVVLIGQEGLREGTPVSIIGQEDNKGRTRSRPAGKFGKKFREAKKKNFSAPP